MQASNVEEATDKIVDLWVEIRDKVFDADHVEFTRTLNLGKMIKQLVEKQEAEATGQRRRLSNDDIKDDGALCFGDCENYVRAASAAVPVVVTSALTWIFTIFAL